MSFQGIGAKIMIHKVTDFAKEASSLQKSGELAQANIHNKAAADALAKQQQVQDIYEPSYAEIQREKEHKQEKRKDRRLKGGQQETEESDNSLYGGTVGQSEPRKIDIRI